MTTPTPADVLHRPTSGPLTAAARRVWSLVIDAGTRWRAASERRRGLRELLELDDRELRDVGLDRHDLPSHLLWDRMLARPDRHERLPASWH